MKRLAILWSVVALAACDDASTPGAAKPGPVVVRTDAASPAECANGGSVVSAGRDDNGDGVLEDSEVTTRSVVCRAAPGPGNVVRLVPEPAGAHCPTGGTAVQSGPDRNGNGVLDGDEVVHTDFACEQRLLTRVSPARASASCGLGGTAFLAGRDADRDGVLEDGEVEVRSVQCGDVITGDVFVASDADVAALADARIITGTLFAFTPFDDAPFTQLALAKLERVGGDLTVAGSDGAPPVAIALPSLRSVDGQLGLFGTLAGSFAAPALAHMGRVSVSQAGVAELGGFAATAVVDGDVTILLNPALTTIRWTGQRVAGKVLIELNDQLTSIDLSASQIGPLSLSANPALMHVAVHADRLAALDVESGADALDVALDAATIDGDLRVSSGAHLALRAAGADHVAIGGDLDLVNVTLQAFESDAPLVVQGSLLVSGTLLPRFDPGHAVSVAGDVTLSLNSALAASAPLTVASTSNVKLFANPELAHLDFLDAPAHAIGGLSILDQAALIDAPSLDAITTVHGDLDVEDNPALTALSAASLAQVDGSLSVRFNDRVLGASFPRLVRVRDSLTVVLDAALQRLALPALTEVPGTMTVQSNSSLRDVALDALALAQTFQMSFNPVLPSCAVNAIAAHVTARVVDVSNNGPGACAP
ncbi:MAG TPA: hypothetical protein VFP84_18035 [Kofleriaceae bacterium]|nr:hypothetical protein [Kofleriaceae bacterium]